MSVEAVPITDSEEEVVSFHKVLYNDISILVDFLFFLCGESCPVAKGEFRYDVLFIGGLLWFSVFC